MLLMVEEGIRGGICHSIHRYAKANNKYMKNYNSYNKNDNKGYILEVEVKYPKRFLELHSDLPFLLERLEINKCKKLVCNLFNKKNMSHTQIH